MNDFLYLQSMNNYLVKHRDEEMALHIHDLQKMSFDKNLCSSGDYYLGQLYRKVFKRYPELLKPKLFELLDDEKGRHSWIDLLSTGYPQEQGEEEPMYMLIPIDEWFLWLDKAKEWFKKDIPHWGNEIEKELLHNAHEKAIYD